MAGTSRPERVEEVISMGLTEEEKVTLLRIARMAIECRLSCKDIPEFEIDSETLKEKRGGFVTLEKRGQLRGCIGYIEARKPLYETVEEMALAAAFGDPRFPPLTAAEFKDVTVEISVLTPLKKITDVGEIEVGVHGIYMVSGYCSGLLLPQVAVRCKWDRKTFLRETCRKAGLPPDAWQDRNTKIYIFSAEIFCEE
jgi:AmmeMemoRadiSam system protein A